MTVPQTPLPLRLLDADVLIDIQRRHPPALIWFGALFPSVPAVPGFVVMELYQSAQNRRQEREVDVLLAPLPIIWPSASDSQRALIEFRQLHLSHSLGLIDALIAATAIGLGATLCTFNVKHYQAIAGLVLEQPYTR